MNENQPIRRLEKGQHGKLAGVCDGVANYFNIDPTIVRLGFVAATVFGGAGVVVYAAAWILMPDADPVVGHQTAI